MIPKRKMYSLFTFQMKKFKFTKTNKELYVFTSKIKKYQSINIQLVNTIDKNQAFYTHHQFERAKKAKDLYHVLRTPLIKDIKTILQINMIANNLITIKDIKIAQQISGQDIKSLIGKTTKNASTSHQ